MKKLLLTLGVALMAMTSQAAIVNMLDDNNSTFENGEKNGWSSWGTGSSSEVVNGGYESTYCLELVNTVAGDDYYTSQAAYTFGTPLTNGTEYTLSFWAKSKEEGGSIQIAYQNSSTYSGGGYKAVNLTTEWKQYTNTFTVNGEDMDRILISFGKVVGTFYVDDIVFGVPAETEGGWEAPKGYGVVLSGSTADGSKISAWDAAFTGDSTHDGVSCIAYTNETAGDSYTKQLAIDMDYEAGTTYYIVMDVMGDPSNVAIGAWFQDKANYSTIGGYSTFNTFKVTSDTEWTQVVLTGEYEDEAAANRVAINLGEYVGTVYFTNIKVYAPVDEPENPEPDEPGFVVPTGYKAVIEGNTADGSKISAWDAAFTGDSTHDGVPCIAYTNETAGDSYTKQLAIDYNYAPGTTYYIVMDVMGDSSDVAIGAWFQNTSDYSTVGGYSTFDTFKVTSDTEWTQVVLTGKYEDTNEANRVAINLGEYVGTAYFTNIKLYAPEDLNNIITSVANADVNAPVYNLQGVKVGTSENLNNLPKGIYIVNGKKVLR